MLIRLQCGINWDAEIHISLHDHSFGHCLCSCVALGGQCVGNRNANIHSIHKVSHNFNIVCNISCNCLLIDSDFSQSRVYSYSIIDQEKGNFYMYLGLRKAFSVTVIKLGEEKR